MLTIHNLHSVEQSLILSRGAQYLFQCENIIYPIRATLILKLTIGEDYGYGNDGNTMKENSRLNLNQLEVRKNQSPDCAKCVGTIIFVFLSLEKCKDLSHQCRREKL